MSAPCETAAPESELFWTERFLRLVSWVSAGLVLVASSAAGLVLYFETPNYATAYSAYQLKRFPKQASPLTADSNIPELPTDQLPAITVWLLRNSELAAALLLLPGLGMVVGLAWRGTPPDPLLSAGLLALVLMGMVGCLLAVQIPLQELASPALTSSG